MFFQMNRTHAFLRFILFFCSFLISSTYLFIVLDSFDCVYALQLFPFWFGALLNLVTDAFGIEMTSCRLDSYIQHTMGFEHQRMRSIILFISCICLALNHIYLHWHSIFDLADRILSFIQEFWNIQLDVNCSIYLIFIGVFNKLK